MADNDTIRLYYNKYNNTLPIRCIDNPEFYRNLKKESNTTLDKICVYLTNGANTRVDSTGGGTTAGFASIKTKTGVDLFDNRNFTVIFDSNSFVTTAYGELRTIINDSAQVATTNVGSTEHKLSAGSVINIRTTGTGEFPVCGGYHIKGIQWNIITGKEKEKLSVPLVKEYYNAILNDFIKNATQDNTFYILHLAQIPGGLYGGTQITGDAMHEAVQKWVEDHSADKKNFMISIDFAKPTSGNSAPKKTLHAIPTKPAAAASPAAKGPSAAVTKGPSTPSKLSHLLEVEMAHATGKETMPAFTTIQKIYNDFFKPAHGGATRNKDALTASIGELVTNLNSMGVDVKYAGALTAISTSLTSATVESNPLTSANPSAAVVSDGASADAKTTAGTSSSGASNDVCAIAVSEDVKQDVVDKQGLYNKNPFSCTHDLCKKYSNKPNPTEPGTFYKNVVSSCFAILIYDGRDARGADSNHGKILLASEHVTDKDKEGQKRGYNLFGGGIDSGKCPLQALYDEVAEEGRFLEIGKLVENSKPFNDIFKDNGAWLSEPCIVQPGNALTFIGVVSKNSTIWICDVKNGTYKPGEAQGWNGNAAELTGIFANINKGKSGGAFVPIYGEKNEFGFFSDDDIATKHTVADDLYGMARNILQNETIKKKIAKVRKNIDIIT